MDILGLGLFIILVHAKGYSKLKLLISNTERLFCYRNLISKSIS